MGSLTKKAAIVGVAESDIGVVPDLSDTENKTPYELVAQATKRALDDAGLDWKEIDGVCAGRLSGGGLPAERCMALGEYLQLQPKFIDTTDCGGASPLMHVQHATAAIAMGLCSTVMISYGSTWGGNNKRGWPAVPVNDPRIQEREFDAPYGAWMMAAHALAAQRHMYQFGTTSKQYAELAVAMRKWAMMNPIAKRRNPITIDDVISSPMICSPLHLLDCCSMDDGGGTIILTSPERARNLKKPPIWVLGCGATYTHMSVATPPDLTRSAVEMAGEIAFEMAGVTHNDIDVAELYSATTWVNLMQYEALGFCGRGEGGPFVEGGRTAPGGDFPANTDGGGLSLCHPGAFGTFLLIEAVRQLRGECGERQVPGAEVALCNGCGGQAGSACTVILGRD